VTRARRSSRRALTVTAAVIILGAAAAAVVTARGGHGGGAPQGHGTAAPSAAPASAAPALPQVSFAGVHWTSYYGVQLPSSPSAGPRRTSGGLASGYSDTPLGALLAALNIAVRANAQWGPGIFGPTIRDQVTGPDAAALLAECQSAYSQEAQAAHVTGDGPLGDAFVTEEAFPWVDWTPADATVDLVSAGPGSGGTTVRASVQVQVTWDGGDWKVIAPPGGDWGNSAALLTSLDGYTIFPGQG
jgi:hypothetical protein